MTRRAEPAAWRLDIEDLIRRPAPGLDAPEEARFTPDGTAVTYLYGPGQRRSLWRLDLATGQRRRLADAGQETTGAAEDRAAGAGDAAGVDRAEQLRRERTRTYSLGITRYAWSGPPERPVLLVPVGSEWLVGIGAEPDLVPLATISGASEALLSPDGRRIAFVRGGDVWLATDGDETPRRITADAEAGVTNGVAEYIAAEELKRHEGMWWSHDGSQLAIARVDERQVEEVLVPHLGTSGELERHRYPRPGGRNAQVRLRLAHLADRRLSDVRLPMGPDDYLARVVPRPAGGFLVAVLPRAQDELRWLWVDGDGAVTEGWLEHGGRWVNLDDDTRVLPDDRVLRTTERSGFRHLELREPSGSVRQLTDGPWVVTRLVAVDEEREAAVVVGTRDGVLERHVYAVSLTGGPLVRLSREPGWHEALLSPDGAHWLDTWSSRHRSPSVVVRDRAEGRIVATVHRGGLTTASLGLPAPDLLEVQAADGTTPLKAAYYPAEASECPALVVSTYGGPHSQKVMEHWSLTVDLSAQLLAQHGIAVLVVDNRGTYNRGTAFEAPLHRALGSVEVADTAAAVRQLVELGLADASRVGIMGWSYGGYMVLRAMTAEPDLFRAGVAGAPVVDWTLYDSAYTERYLGTPATDGAAYRASSVTDRLGELHGELRGELLVLHGVIDENVHLRHSVRLAAALRASGQTPSVVLLAGERHGVRSAEALRHRFTRTIAHLESALRPGEGPAGPG